MTKTKSLSTILGVLVAMNVLACGSDDATSEDANSGKANGISVEGTGALVSQNSEVSACGGFEKLMTRDLAGYCDAERLLWAYDSVTRILTLRHARVALNCCGERSIDVYYESASNVYDVVEKDALGEDGLPCRCMCTFDFQTEIANVEPGSVNMVVRRHSGGGANMEEVWTGVFGLDGQSGEFIVSDVPLLHCGDM